MRRVYLALPLSIGTRLHLIDVVYRTIGPLFRGTPHYESWKRSRAARGTLAPPSIDPLEAVSRLGELWFTEVEHPLVSIIIPTYGNLPITANCLLSIRQHWPRCSVEVLVAEDASGDPAIARLKDVRGLVSSSERRTSAFSGTATRPRRGARAVPVLPEQRHVRDGGVARPAACSIRQVHRLRYGRVEACLPGR